MTVTAYRIGNSDEGATQIEQVGVYDIFSWIIKSTQKAIAGGGLIVYDAQITSTEKLPEDAAIEIEKQWFKVATPAVGMMGMYRHFLVQTARPQ